MKLMRTEDAIGQVLCHDITQIIPGVKKGPVFQKGHIIAPEDVPVLLSVGKEHVYIWEKDDTRFHENEAARILCEMSQNANMKASDPSEGKIELTAQVDGLFTLDRQRLYAVNSLGEMMIATRHAGPVKKGDKLAGMRVIPLVIEKEKMAEARETAGNTPLLTLTPYRALKVGLVTTGSEVYYGRIQDQFTPVIKAKLEDYLENAPKTPAATAAPAPATAPAAPAAAAKDTVLSACLNGTVVPLAEVKDEAFASGALGDGIAIEPIDGELVAPADGEISSTFETHHAVGMTTVDGAELLMHIGIDTVKLGGKHFTYLVSEGDKVKKGQPLIRFDLEAIKAEGYPVTTPLIVCNTDDYAAVAAKASGTVKQGDALLELKH